MFLSNLNPKPMTARLAHESFGKNDCKCANLSSPCDLLNTARTVATLRGVLFDSKSCCSIVRLNRSSVGSSASRASSTPPVVDDARKSSMKKK